jgi:hypothetical protein
MISLKHLLALLLFVGFRVCVGQTVQLVVVYVDFPDGRLPDMSLPAVDSDLSQVANINAVGSLGWVGTPPHNYQLKVRKYTYDDYWDAIFSTAPTYTGQRHPDYGSHQGYVASDLDNEQYDMTTLGSVRDFWAETSYGHLQIQAVQTRNGGSDKYHTGIVNNTISANGKTYIRWIKLGSAKTMYYREYGVGPGTLEPLYEIDDTLRALYARPVGHPDRIEFNVDSFSGCLAVITAGGRCGGWAWPGMNRFVIPEKITYATNDSHSAIINPITEFAHEFGHAALDITHQAVGAYDIMHWGGLGGHVRNYMCPPHVNPLLKLHMGWLTSGDVISVHANSSVTLPAITSSNKKIALVTICGDAGRDNSYENHSEYFLIEYRKREGFNARVGGSDPNFQGGALIWHYTTYGQWAYEQINCDVRKDLTLEVPNYTAASFKGNGGDPSHFYYPSHNYFGPTTTPSTSSFSGYNTGITISGFTVSSNGISFDINYTLGDLPTYGTFVKGGESYSQ